ncbi:major facilitator superfamily domain-containing protein [Aspergillus ambiguus]|uniref:major facilitator superfamily domain-containing protein n=1 Tax=Aspergillus ambiguus TaxID=176160 RepID=UPI003CCD23BF
MANQQAAVRPMHDQSDSLPYGQLLVILTSLILSQFITLVDQNGISITLPTIASDLNTQNTISWAGTSSLIGNTMFSMLYGRLSDIFGRKKVYLFVLAVLCGADLLCAFSQDAAMFYIGRGLAGTAGGGIMSLSVIIVSDIIPLEYQGKYQGILGAFLGLSNLLGPFIAAGFTTKLTWRGFFWLIGPLALCSLMMGYFILRDTIPDHEDGPWESLKMIDYLGIITSSTGVVFLLLPISGGGSYFEWSSPMIITMLAIGSCALVAFVFVEWKLSRMPMLPVECLKNKVIATIFLQSFMFGAAYQSYLYYLPLFYQNVRGWSPIISAALTAPMVTGQSIGSIVSGQYITRRQRYGEVIWVGFGIWTVGSGLTVLYNRTIHPGAIIVVGGIVGVGVGFVFQPTLLAAQAHCRKAQRAAVISSRNFFRCLGGACGLAASAAILQRSLRSSLPTKYLHISDSTYSRPLKSDFPQSDWGLITEAYMKASRGVFILQVPLVGICFIACLLIRDRGMNKAHLDREERPSAGQSREQHTAATKEKALR